jgi:hypothetical protein
MFRRLTDRTWGTHPVWGYDSVNSRWLWYASDDSKWYIAEKPVKPLKSVDSGDVPGTPAILYASGLLLKEKDYYSGGGLRIWWNGAKWILNSHLGYGTEERVDVASTTENTTVTTTYTYLGDTWWESSSLIGTYAKRGADRIGVRTVVTLNGNTTSDTTAQTSRKDKVVSWGKVVGWVAEIGRLGKYTPESDSGLTGDKYVGWIEYKAAARQDSPYELKTTTVTTTPSEGEPTTEVAYETKYVSTPYVRPPDTNETETLEDGSTVQTTVTRVLKAKYRRENTVGDVVETFEPIFTDIEDVKEDKPVMLYGKDLKGVVRDDLKLWFDGLKWIASAAVGTKDKKAGYWEGADLPGTLERKWEGPDATVPPSPPVLDLDKNSYTMTLYEGGEAVTPTLRQKDMLIAQVAMWL